MDRPMTQSRLDVAIIGAGPYGLSLAAHLRSRRVGFRIFGHPMRPWSRMHKGMGLKSPDFGTNVYAPARGFRFVEWCRKRGISTEEPIAIDLFTQYGLWAQEQLVPDLEQTDVTELRRNGNSFQLTLATGETLLASRVVVATGLAHYARIPAEFRELASTAVSHTTEHREYSEFAGRSVAVVGGGSSALEAGVLLHEAGADVSVLVRGSYVYLGGPKPTRRSLRDRILQPNSVMGPGRKSFMLQRLPLAMHFLPTERRVRFVRSYLGPAAGWWLFERAQRVTIQLRTRVLAADPSSKGVRLRLGVGPDERDLEVEHVVCGTGFEVNADRLPFLDAGLAGALRRIERAPALSRNFESSVPGLYFIGPASAFSFGPLFRFVAGAAYAAPAVARHLARTRRRQSVPARREAVTEPA